MEEKRATTMAINNAGKVLKLKLTTKKRHSGLKMSSVKTPSAYSRDRY
jgi:hypothetical protein